ncbi:MAG: hypothetical protein U0354_08935 [Candidatus Sericytochromatia bacterium]
MYIKKISNQKGQALVPTLGITLALTLLIATIGLNFKRSQSQYTEKNKLDDLSYALKSVEKQTLNNLFNTMTNQFNIKISDWDNQGASNEHIMTPSVAQSLSISAASVSNTSLSNSTNTGTFDTKNGQSINIFSVPCNDTNSDGSCTTGENGLRYIKSELNSTNKEKIYYYSYSVTSYAYIGNSFSTSNLKKKLTTSGSFNLVASARNLAEFALLANNTDNAWFWWGDTVTGPIHTNGKFKFMGDPTQNGKSTSFLSKASQSANNVDWYYSGGGTSNSGTLSTTEALLYPTKTVSGVDKVKPTFAQGLLVNAPTINLPQNSKNYERIAIGRPETEISNTTAMTVVEKGIELGVTPSGSPLDIPKNIYVANTGGAAPAIKGGIYINGDVEDITMSVESNKQVYDIKQTAGGSKRQKITIDKATNSTIVQTLNYTTGAVTSTQTYSGVPRGSLHVEGKINNLGGLSRPTSTPNDPSTAPVAVQSENKLTISAKGDIFVSRDIKYQDDPRTNPDAENMLGFISGEGQVIIKDPAPKDINIHGIVLAGKTGTGSFAVQNYNTRVNGGAIHLLGGTIFDSLSPTQNTSGNGFDTDYVYDVRTSNGKAPPYFPSGPVNQKSPRFTIDGISEEKIR